MIPLIAFATMQSRHLDLVLMRVDWITPRTPLGAIKELLGYLTRALGRNWVAILASAGVVFGVRRGFDADRLKFVMMLAGALLAATAVTLAINASHPIIIERYFMFLYAGAACLIATLLGPEIAESRWLARGILLNAATFTIIFGAKHASELLWEDGARKVAALVEQCPTTRVHGGALPPDMAERTGLAYLAAEHHFSILPGAADRPDACPVAYWILNHGPGRAEIARFHGDVARATNFTARLDLPETTLAETRPITIDGGVVLVVGRQRGSSEAQRQ